MQCECGWFYASQGVAAKWRVPAECTNPVHREPPRDVECPHCGAPAGTDCRGSWRSEPTAMLAESAPVVAPAKRTREFLRIGARRHLAGPKTVDARRHAVNGSGWRRGVPAVTLMLEAGVSLLRAQEAAAHADPRTTVGYNRARIRLAQHPTHELARHILEEDGPDSG